MCLAVEMFEMAMAFEMFEMVVMGMNERSRRRVFDLTECGNYEA